MLKINKKQAELALLLGMAISVFCAGFCGFEENYREITDTVFRLHILANSDSDSDQAIKLKVRDAVLEEFSCIFEGKVCAEEAAAAALEHIDEICGTAERILSENGRDYPVSCEITKMKFDSRVYDKLTMPAGEYTALRISIGEASGKNWWCVMFPPLCLPAAANIDEALEECGGIFTEEELDMLQNPENYECRLYILELYEKLRDALCA